MDIFRMNLAIACLNVREILLGLNRNPLKLKLGDTDARKIYVAQVTFLYVDI